MGTSEEDRCQIGDQWRLDVVGGLWLIGPQGNGRLPVNRLKERFTKLLTNGFRSLFRISEVGDKLGLSIKLRTSKRSVTIQRKPLSSSFLWCDS